jgi:hypothetical protein
MLGVTLHLVASHAISQWQLVLEATQVDAIENEGGSFIRGAARFIGRGPIEVETESDTRRLQSIHIVIATGSEPAIPQIPGLSDIGFWEQVPPFGEIYLTAVDQLLAASIQRRGRSQSSQMMDSTGQETRQMQD